MLYTLAFLAASAPVADVLDVDGVQGPYTEISAAVVAASDGDVIRVAPGTYGSFAIRGKSLTVVAPDGADVYGVVRIQELAANQSATVQNLTLRTIAGQDEERLIIGLNEGAVRCSHLTVAEEPISGQLHAKPGARVIEADDVVFTNCLFEGVGRYGISSAFASHGLWCIDSRVAVFDSWCRAVGEGERAGIGATGSELLVVGSTLIGSDGSSDMELYDPTLVIDPCIGFATNGGAGVWAYLSNVRILGCELQGGPGGFVDCGTFGFGFFASDGPRVRAINCTVTEYDGSSDAFTAPVIAGEGEAAPITATSRENDLLLLMTGTSSGLRPHHAFVGDFLIAGVQGSRSRRILGFGPATSTYLTPLLPPFGTEQIHFQLVALRPNASSPSGRDVILFAPRVMTVLDSAY